MNHVAFDRDYGNYAGHHADPRTPEPEEGTFASTVGDIPVSVRFTETAGGVIVDGVSIGDSYADASCFARGQLDTWKSAIENALWRAAMGYVR